MSKIFQNIKIPIDQDFDQALLEQLSWMMPEHGPYRILRQSIDARTRHSPHFVVSVEVAELGKDLPQKKFEVEKLTFIAKEKPLIIGTGPAGLFAALRLVEHNIPCRIFERGSESTERIKGINRFWRYGELDPRNNVCFGEGGAGLYSDGKLITRIKSADIPYVLNRLVQFGAPPEIEYFSNPHVGSDRIRRVIPKLREYLKSKGCEFHFDCQVTEIISTDQAQNQKKQILGVKTEHGHIFNSPWVVLATGHSATDMLEHLRDIGVYLEGKSYALGLRVEHPQKLINKIQYRELAEHPKLGSANYKLADHDVKTQIGVYSFCMCPGGFVLSSGTEIDGLVCNGMSNYNRNSLFANAALVVSIPHEKMFQNNLWGGLNFRRELEHQAYLQVQRNGPSRALPAQKVTDFLARKNSLTLNPTSSPSGVMATRLDQLLPESIRKRLSEGLESFDKKMKGFISDQAQLYGIESRTSCPIRITREESNLQSLSHRGLYPAGEGAGYAGGITSAACDGVRIADQIFSEIKSQN